MTIISVEKSLPMLALDTLPAELKATTFCNYVNAGLPLYFKCDKSLNVTQGDLSHIEYEHRGYHPDDDDYDYVGCITTNHKVTSIDDFVCTSSVTVDPSTKTDLLVSCVKYENKDYLFCDETGQFKIQFRVSRNSAYVLKNDISTFKKGPFFIQKTTHKGSESSESGLKKALALLIHDMASERSGAKYRCGEKINASVVKDHILALATKYEIDDSYLRSLHNNITPMLKHYDLINYSKPKK
jgi:hypothetical protein